MTSQSLESKGISRKDSSGINLDFKQFLIMQRPLGIDGKTEKDQKEPNSHVISTVDILKEQELKDLYDQKMKSYNTTNLAN